MKKKQFFRNFMIIMLFGAVGTLISTVVISVGMQKDSQVWEQTISHNAICMHRCCS